MIAEPETAPPDRLYALAERQGGYFTASDALEAGYSYPLQHFHVRKGNWLRVDLGIYRLRRFPNSPHEDLIRWWLWARKEGSVSHESAAAFYGLGDILPSKVHLSVPQGFRKKPVKGIVLHKSKLQTGETLEREGFQITSPLRTVLDLAREHLDPERLEAVAADTIRKGLVTRRGLESALKKHHKELDEASRAVLQRACREK